MCAGRGVAGKRGGGEEGRGVWWKEEGSEWKGERRGRGVIEEERRCSPHIAEYVLTIFWGRQKSFK